MVEGQRYEIVQEGRGETQKQFVVDHGQNLLIKGNDDKTVSLLDPAGKEVRKIANGGFKPDGERNPMSCSCLSAWRWW